MIKDYHRSGRKHMFHKGIYDYIDNMITYERHIKVHELKKTIENKFKITATRFTMLPNC